MQEGKGNSVYFIGIGGIGMSALARYYMSRGYTVAGYDKTPTTLTAELEKEGAFIHFSDDVDAIPESCKNKESVIVVYTPAIPSDHSELLFFRKEGFTLYKRSEVLGLITGEMFTIGVAGTHGKTTTSSMIAHLLEFSGLKANAFLGGIATNYNSNFIVHENAENVVVEADEYDRSFLTLSPDIAVVTSMDADHLDIYGQHDSLVESFKMYVDKLPQNGVLIKRKGLDISHANCIEYAVNETADFSARNIRIEEGCYFYDVYTPDTVIENVELGIPGLHNVENSLAAIAVGVQMKLSNEQIKNALKSFKGVKRRFEYHIKTEDLVYVDDYAHHPTELKACIGSVREMYPGKKITGVFQPHLYTRTRDFIDDFAKSLELLDDVILLNIYPARELPIEGVSSEWLLSKINTERKELIPKKELVASLMDRKLEVLLTLGAGDIDELIEPIKKGLSIKMVKE